MVCTFSNSSVSVYMYAILSKHIYVVEFIDIYLKLYKNIYLGTSRKMISKCFSSPLLLFS